MKFCCVGKCNERFLLAYRAWTSRRDECAKAGTTTKFKIELTQVVAMAKKQEWKCKKYGVKFRRDKSKDPFQLSLDQVKPGRGYTAANVHVVCLAYNFMKNNFSEAVADDIIRAIRAVKD